MAKGKKPNPFAKGGDKGKKDEKMCKNCKKPESKCKCK
jgi:hypothetical protein